MKETPGKIILSWGVLFAVAWFVRVHVAFFAGVAVGGCVACLTAWAVATLWRVGVETDRLARYAAAHAPAPRNPAPLDTPDTPEWFMTPAGNVVDRNGSPVH
jgi:hypothetical protein